MIRAGTLVFNFAELLVKVKTLRTGGVHAWGLSARMLNFSLDGKQTVQKLQKDKIKIK